MILSLLLLNGQAFAQEGKVEAGSEGVRSTEGAGLDDGDFGILENVATLLLPRGVRDTWRLKRYLRSEKFIFIKEKLGDTRAVDDIYHRALEISRNDLSEALFISFLATMDHREVGMKLPIVKLPFYFPLTSESEEEFKYRVVNLPRHFYIDSPPGEYGDRDKLQHFFGSAFLAYSFRSRALARLAGNFVEWGEEEFIIGGLSDPRDLRADAQGEEFGIALGDDPRTLPSTFLQVQLVLTGSRVSW
jgi:hypothetical protein